MKNDLTTEQLAQLVDVSLPLGVVLRIAADSAAMAVVTDRAVASRSSLARLPAIGSAFEGGVYAGLSIERESPVALVLTPNFLEDATWNAAMEWAKEKGGVLPSRVDALVLFQNMRSSFKEAAYWTDTPDADDESYAWYQAFTNGSQYYYGQSSKLRAVAVRRINLAI